MSFAARRLRWQLRWQQRRTPPASLDGYLDARAEFDRVGREFGAPADVTVEPDAVGGVPVERLAPRGAAPTRTVLYLHGGAYVMGSLDASRHAAAAIARSAGAEVVNVGYRLAPEHPFPAALDDALAVHRGLLATGLDPRRLVVVGSSAGGGLAVALLVAARDAGLELPTGLVTLSAWADLRCTSPSIAGRARRDPSLTPAGLRLAASLYLAGASPSQPLASPVVADLAGLPPVLALVGTEEILLHDTVALVERVRACGGQARSLIGWGMVHCWTGFVGSLPRAERDLQQVAAFIIVRTP